VEPQGRHAPDVPRGADPADNPVAFNRFFESNRTKNEEFDTGYGGWLSAHADEAAAPRLSAKIGSEAFNDAYERNVRKLAPERMAIIVRPSALGALQIGFSELDPVGLDDYSVDTGGLQASDLRLAHTTERLASEEWLAGRDCTASIGAAAMGRLVAERGAAIAGAHVEARDRERDRRGRDEGRLADVFAARDQPLQGANRRIMM
jgi:hypothetical protein